MCAKAASGIWFYMGVKGDENKRLQGLLADPIEAIRDEVQRYGEAGDVECLNYILFKKAGSNKIRFDNGGMDCDDEGNLLDERKVKHGERTGQGMTIDDFVEAAKKRFYPKDCPLEKEHIVALRLYSTAAYKSINDPLRAKANRQKVTGWFPITVKLIAEGISKLRSVTHNDIDQGDVVDLFRGMRDMKLSDEFKIDGGTEIAPMSTTTDLKVAIQYANRGSKGACLILKLHTKGFMQRGAGAQSVHAFDEPSDSIALCCPRMLFCILR